MGSGAPVALLAAQGVVKSFGGRTVLSGVDLEVARGARLGILGPNGSFDGTVVAASHDRYFLERLADRVVAVGDGALSASVA